MRLGEVLALRVKDLGFRRREIRVSVPKGIEIVLPFPTQK